MSLNYKLLFLIQLTFCFHHGASVPRCKAKQPTIKAKEIEVLWLDSAERKAVMDTLSPSEITRRRYK